MSSKSNRLTCSRSSSARSKHSARVVAQATVDAKLHVDFEESKQLFDYSNSIEVNISSTDSNVNSSTVGDYLQQVKRGKLIQPFGCMIAVVEDTFAVLAYSENAPEMLDLAPQAVPSIEQQEALSIGMDARTLFRSSSSTALQKAATFGKVNLLNPILVHCRNSGKPFYAIMHRIDVGLIIDLEPVNPADVPVTAAGALKSYKLAAKAISRLQSLPSGNIGLLCDVLVHEVSELTGYDRVMAYKFHEDEHGEVIAEYRRSDLEPYLGLHYPATDIPQASRFLFMKNKVRMICDCYAPLVKVIQDKKLAHPLTLCGSTLRAPHGCHAQYMANMGSVASLVMSMTVDDDDEETTSEQQNQKKGTKLWGLVVCHHTSPRFVPFPLRYACEFLIQVFGMQLNKEVELAAQMREKHILQLQTVLCDMLLRDAPVGIMTQSPNVMDLVKCDGAALYYGEQLWMLGTTPTEAQIRDIAGWLHECHDGTTGLSMDSLMEAGYPSAAALGDAVCGMAAVKITSKDFLFWFRSHTAQEINWGGAKHDPVDKDDGKKMHPRSSFKAFLEMVKQRSLPWEDVEMDAIHSLQLILRESLEKVPGNDSKAIVNAQLDDAKIQGIEVLRTVTNEMIRLIETATVPILAVDSFGNVNGWNTKATELTGLAVHQVIGRPLIDLVEEESIEAVKNMIHWALHGKEERDVEIELKTFSDRDEDNGPVILVVNACSSRDVEENVVGVCFVGQNITEQKMVMEKFTRIRGDYTAIVQSPSALIPPIFIIDECGCCVEWNSAMQKLSGLKRVDMIGRILVGEIFGVHGFGFRVKDHDTLTKLRIVLNSVIAGQDVDKLRFGFFDRHGIYVKALLSTNKRTDSEGRITGALCFLHLASPELQQALQVQRLSEKAAANRLKELAYIRQEIKHPLNGIIFMRNLMEASDLTEEQKQLLRTSAFCQEQLAKILNDVDLESIEECYLELSMVEFNLGEALEAVTNQGMTISKERQVQLVRDWPPEVSSMCLYGDHLRLQQVLSDFLLNALQFTSPSEGSVMFGVIARKEHCGTGVHIVHLEFRIAHPAPGIPEALIEEMVHHSREISREGLGLYISQKLVKIMNGTAQYIREADTSSFIVLVEFPLASWHGKQKLYPIV